MASPFFFSYAHNDTLDPHLDDFFDEVNRRVRLLTGSKSDGFRDDRKLRAGELWSQTLVGELRDTPAIVCMYSPSYFNSQVCAQELQVFLERRRDYIAQNAGSLPGNIIPVLWIPPLKRIPIALPDFEYAKPRSASFKDGGVWDVGDAGTGPAKKEFNAIAQQVALRVKEAFKTPLPSLGYQPALGGVDSAFDPPPLPPKNFDVNTGTGPHNVTYVYAHAPAWNAWPFKPADDPLLHISAAAAKGRDLQPHQLTFDPTQPTIVAELDEVRKKNNLLVLLVDGASLADVPFIARFREFDSRNYDASTIVVWRPGTRPPTLQQLVAQAFPTQGLRQPPFFYSSIDSADAFADAITRSLDTLKTVVSRQPYGIPPASSTSDFSEVPLVSATRRAA